MDDETRRFLGRMAVVLVVSVLGAIIPVAVTSRSFRDDLRAWWERLRRPVFIPPRPEPTEADIAWVYREVRRIQEEGPGL